MNRLLASAAMSIGFAVAAVPAYAQPAGGPPDGRMERHRVERHGMQRDGEMRPFSKPTERVEARLAYVKTALKITDAQQPQWNAYADRMRQLAAEHEKMRKERRAQMADGKGHREHQRPTAIERLERAQKMHADAIHRINEQLEVQKPLYAVLSNEQKQVADVVLAPHAGRGMSRHARGPGRGWGRA